MTATDDQAAVRDALRGAPKAQRVPGTEALDRLTARLDGLQRELDERDYHAENNEARVRELEAALRGLKLVTDCWCPNLDGHDLACSAARLSVGQKEEQGQTMTQGYEGYGRFGSSPSDPRWTDGTWGAVGAPFIGEGTAADQAAAPRVDALEAALREIAEADSDDPFHYVDIARAALTGKDTKLEEALREYDEWASRMPDAGCSTTSLRVWDWWHRRPTRQARAALTGKDTT